MAEPRCSSSMPSFSLLSFYFQGRLSEIEKLLFAADIRVIKLQVLLFVSMDTRGKRVQVVSLGLFPDSSVVVTALVEQDICLICLKLVLCEWGHAGVIVEAPPVFI